MNARALLGGLLPFITSPVGIAALGVGALGFTIYNIFTDKEEGQENGAETVPNGSEPYEEPFYKDYKTIDDTVYPEWGTVERTVDDAVSSSVEESFETTTIHQSKGYSTPEESMSDEELKKEMIRQTMSELGKRSAAARAEKKQNR